jgi:hypothetical protein
VLAEDLGELGLDRYSFGACFLRDTGPTVPRKCLRTTRITVLVLV